MNRIAILADIAAVEAKRATATDRHDIRYFELTLINLRAELSAEG